MTDVEPEEDLPPVAHVTLVYNGPVAPHWDLKVHYGDRKMLDDFWTRVNARLLLLPKHDPQFRRNRERVNRDAERERVICDWDLGEDDAESTRTPMSAPPVEVEAAADEPAADEPTADAHVDADAEAEVDVDTDVDVEAEVEVDAEPEVAAEDVEVEVEVEPQADDVEAESEPLADEQPAGQV